MTIIIFHIRRPDNQENVSYVLNFYVSDEVHFSHFDELKSTFFTSLHFAPQVMYYFGFLKISNRVPNLNKRINLILAMSVFEIRQLEKPVFI